MVVRTRIQDMQVGDYIVCNYSATSGAVGTLSNLGGAPTTELPLGGSDTPNGSFYFIKVDKGLLIADRVVQHSISWDALNSGKLIQGGIPWNALPVMTSNTTPNGIASASSIFTTDYDAWQAFNRTIDALGWASDSPTFPQWLSYEFPVEKVITGYLIRCRTDDVIQAPKDWTFEGWDGQSWVVLDTRTDQTGWVAGGSRSYLFTNTTAFIKYRLVCNSNNGSTVAVSAGELEMFEVEAVTRSLTGGVAYADANNYSTTTDASNGGWPADNEWDKYIVNSDLGGKITKGDDNVWHWYAGVATWVQDTPVLAWQGASNRVVRSPYYASPAWYGASVNYVSYGGSSAVVSYVGFRPVFEYEEG
jgi:hypothetical protein